MNEQMGSGKVVHWTAAFAKLVILLAEQDVGGIWEV